MNFSDIKLPSNQKFGLFFAAVFAVVFVIFFSRNAFVIAWIFAGTSIIFALFAKFKPELLLPLNKLWMRFGFLLGMVVSPIVLGLMFFLMFTPIGLFMRIFGRDELRLKAKNMPSYWKQREPNQPSIESFERQF